MNDKIVINDSIKLKDESVLKSSKEESGRATFNSEPPGGYQVFGKLVNEEPAEESQAIPGNHIHVDRDQVIITIPMTDHRDMVKQLIFSKREFKQVLQEILYG